MLFLPLFVLTLQHNALQRYTVSEDKILNAISSVHFLFVWHLGSWNTSEAYNGKRAAICGPL